MKAVIRLKSVFICCLLLTAYCLLPALTFSQFYNGSQMEFGKNRVQFNESRAWQWYKFDKCNVYFYMGGKELAIYTSRQAKKYTENIEKLFDYNLDDKVLFIVYNKQSDFKQSNVGLEYEEPTNIGGVTKIVGSKVSLYFNGDHADLDKQIKAGIVEVLINQMMYGGNVKDMVKNSTLLNLPRWYIQGLVAYISNEWNTDIDSRVRDGILTNKYKRFNGLDGTDAVFAGHSIWNYIAETYGTSVISNILYMTKVSRNVESAFLFVLGVSMKTMTNDWMQYYIDRYNKPDESKDFPERSVLKKIKGTRVYQHFKISSDGNYAIYTTNELGQYKVWLYDFKKKIRKGVPLGKAKRIMKHEKKLDRPADYSYPLLAWHPNGELFAIITERKGGLLLSYYTLSKKKLETLKIFNFEKILDFSYSDDGKQFVMSAVQNGQSDIYVYNVASASYEQITKDIYDDLTPKFMNGSSKIIFASNRPNDTIRFMNGYPLNLSENLQPMNQKDLFIYNYKQKNPVLRRVTNSPLVNESYPCEFDKEHLCFLSDENGIRNRYLGILDSAISYVDTTEHYRYLTRSYPITNYSRNIQEQDINLKSKKISEVVFNKKKYRMFISDMPDATIQMDVELQNTSYKEYILKQFAKEKVSQKENEPKVVQNVQVIIKEEKQSVKDSIGFDINNYTFENESKKETKTPPSPVQSSPDTTTAHVASFQLPQQRNYFIFFSTDYVITQLDNSYLNPVYQKFTGPGAIYLNPGFTGFFKIGLSDLFDDYKITGGVRLSGNLNSNEYYMSYENRMHRLDKQLVLHRQALLDFSSGSSSVKIHTHDVQYVLKYPFNETSSLRGTLSIRDDRTAFLATNDYNLAHPNTYEYWGGSKLEYVYDDTRKRGLNAYHGTRLKFFAEYYKQINKQETDMEVVGCDIRHYTKIHRDFIWATRFSASTSLGKQKLIYYMGGVDNWLSPKFNNSTPIDLNQNYMYQTLATPMRGFIQNIRNGNSFALINNELRLPVFRYLMNRPLKSDFLNNFQIIGFGDVGTAWTGKTPYDDKNSLYTQTIGGPPSPVTVVVQTRREPIVAGYGWGIRSRLLGYFMRLDWAHGWEDGKIGKRVFYWSISLDF
ncbi:MAG: PD40 domain-containing protein [Bacteroidetes bacterium]|nr:PD40 domain-containing protein [Bacteroidota bacterium]